MVRERWRQVDSLFQAVHDKPAAEREQLLNQACRGDDSLRREVECC
jgi:hypothetical protein